MHKHRSSVSQDGKEKVFLFVDVRVLKGLPKPCDCLRSDFIGNHKSAKIHSTSKNPNMMGQLN